jgi:hypothetical protein
MEWAELDHIMGRKHAGQVKAFLSQATDLYRVPYGKATQSFPLGCQKPAKPLLKPPENSHEAYKNSHITIRRGMV